MARKVGLNRKEQIQCAKWLSEGVEPKMIAKEFRTSVGVVSKFTQEALDAAADAAAKRAGKQNLIIQKQRKTAAVLKEVIDKDKDAKDFI